MYDRRPVRPALPLLLLLACAACATAAQRPPDVFVTGRDPRYPPARYLVGVGTGSSLELARRQAAASIAAQLQASLRATEVVFASVRSGLPDEEQLLQEVRVESRFDRQEWIQLADAVAVDDRVHALCVLDRIQAAAHLETELQIRRAALRESLALAAARADLRGRSEALAAAARTAREMMPALATLAALQGAPTQPPPELHELAAARLSLARERREASVRVCVEPALPQGPAPDVAARFDALLAAAGIRALPCAADEPWDGLRLDGRLVADPLLLPAQAGSYPRFCTVRLDWRLRGDRVAAGGSVGGAGNRAGGHDFHQACLASAGALAGQLAVELGFRDAPEHR